MRAMFSTRFKFSDGRCCYHGPWCRLSMWWTFRTPSIFGVVFGANQVSTNNEAFAFIFVYFRSQTLFSPVVRVCQCSFVSLRGHEVKLSQSKTIFSPIFSNNQMSSSPLFFMPFAAFKRLIIRPWKHTHYGFAMLTFKDLFCIEPDGTR